MAGLVTWRLAWAQSPAPPPKKGLPSTLTGIAPIPMPRVQGGTVTTWLPVPLSADGSAYPVTEGKTYRATAQIDASGVSITDARISGYLQGQGFTVAHIYDPGATLPADWPDRTTGADVWGVEASRAQGDASIPVAKSASLLVVSVDAKVLSVFVEEQVSATAPAREITISADTTTVDVAPGSVVRVRVSGPAFGTSWQWEEIGTIASIVAQSTDPKTGELLTDILVGGGDAVVIGYMVDPTRNAVLDRLVFGLHSAAASSPPAPPKNA